MNREHTIAARPVAYVVDGPDTGPWYAIPPYRNEGWRAFNVRGELVATFERRVDCEHVVELHNRSLR